MERKSESRFMLAYMRQEQVADGKIQADGNGGARDGAHSGPDREDAAHSAPGGEEGHEALTVSYERLRHSTDEEELHEFARHPLPDRSDQAAFSRFTALLEAVAGNAHTPVDDRVFLAGTMPFPNILVKLSQDVEPAVRRAVAANTADKNWLVGLLTKDPDPWVRAAALVNPMTSWKMRLEGAEDPRTDRETLAFLSELGVDREPDAPAVLASMVRRAVALNPNTDPAILDRLRADPSGEVARAASGR